jgi:hypothetical protein
MATTAEQSYANHAHRPVAFGLVWLGALIATSLFLWVAYRDRSLVGAALVLLGLVTLAAISLLRVFALRLQDRIIRLEMRVRLAKLGREALVDRLPMKQVVALRFAPDEELAALADRALAEQLSPDQIKRAIKNWRPDHLRT